MIALCGLKPAASLIAFDVLMLASPLLTNSGVVGTVVGTDLQVCPAPATREG
jgi:hypothetical protein